MVMNGMSSSSYSRSPSFHHHSNRRHHSHSFSLSYTSSPFSQSPLTILRIVIIIIIIVMMQHVQETSSYTIVVGLNPALQRRFILSSKTPLLTPGNVHRASEIQEGIGGKGQDVYVALHCLSSFRTNINNSAFASPSPSPSAPTSGITSKSSGGSSSSSKSTSDPSPYPSTNSNSSNTFSNKSFNSNDGKNRILSNRQNRSSYSKGSTNVILAQFLGKGTEGDAVLSFFLDRYEKDMDLSLTVRCEDKLRICTTIINSEQTDNNLAAIIAATSSSPPIPSSTELIEPSGTIQPNEVQELRDSLKEMMVIGGAGPIVRGVCIMGSMPPGVPSSLYADLYRYIMSQQSSVSAPSGGGGADAGVGVGPKAGATTDLPLCLIDSVVGLDHLFHEMNVNRNHASSSKTNMLKINMAELCKMTGTSTTSMVYDVSNAEADAVRRAVSTLYTLFPESREALDYVAVTNGIFPAYMVHVHKEPSYNNNKDVMYRFKVPMLSQLRSAADDMGRGTASATKLYTIGAGDAVAASTLAAWEYLNNRKEDQRLDESIRASLLKRVVFGEDIANTAFSFGLACGTASCIERENSVFDVPKALQLFEQMERPQKVKLT